MELTGSFLLLQVFQNWVGGDAQKDVTRTSMVFDSYSPHRCHKTSQSQDLSPIVWRLNLSPLPLLSVFLWTLKVAINFEQIYFITFFYSCNKMKTFLIFYAKRNKHAIEIWRPNLKIAPYPMVTFGYNFETPSTPFMRDVLYKWTLIVNKIVINIWLFKLLKQNSLCLNKYFTKNCLI